MIVLASLSLLAGSLQADRRLAVEPTTEPASFDCGQIPDDWIAEFRQAVHSGLVPTPTFAAPPAPAAPPPSSCLTPEHVFLYEDRDKLFKTTLTHAQRLAIMVDAANHLIAEHGDHFDFIGFFLSFKAKNPLGAAFYQPIFNDVEGIGDPLADGTTTFDTRRLLGLASHRVQGFVMMWGVKQWEGGTGTSLALGTRLGINHEFGHRFACYLPPLADGRALEGTVPCGTSGHWNGQVDAQASCLLIGEWSGADPAIRSFPGGWFNQDVPGGMFSWFELYLMGYASAQELDSAPSELRFVAERDCSSPSYAPISSFTSQDVIATAGPRIPRPAEAQKDFRTAWIMIHLPDKPPDAEQLGIAVAVLEQQPLDWATSTLGRGSMSHALFVDRDCDGVPDERQQPAAVCSARPSADGCTPSTSLRGVPSRSAAEPCELVAHSIPAGRPGVLLLGSVRDATRPLESGSVCVGAPFVRAGAQLAGGLRGCEGSLTFDVSAWLRARGTGSNAPAATYRAQFAYLGHGTPLAMGLTEAVQFCVQR